MSQFLTKPNIILLTIDTLRPDRLGCYGMKPSLTPNIDRMASTGVRFTQAITGGSWTQAAFPVMLTSTYASAYGGCISPLAPERPSPVQCLADCGFATAAFVTSPLLGRSYAYQRGFEHFADLAPGEKDPALRKIKGGHSLLRMPTTHVLARLIGKRSRPAKLYVSAEQLTDAVCQWIGQAQKPFFIWAHYMDIHWPYHLEDELCSPQDIAQAWTDLVHLHNANWEGAEITPAQRDHYIRLYERAVAYTDTHLGQLFEFLDSARLSEETVIILLSDHGEEFLEHQRWGHWEDNLHDEVLRVPLIMKIPGYAGPSAIDQQIRLIDLMPTVLDLWGCPPPAELQGKSLAALLDGSPNASLPEVAVSEMWREAWHIISVRTEAYKYIWDSKKTDQARLYDLRHDPGEKYNIADELPGVVREMHQHVEQRLREMVDTRPKEVAAGPELDAEMLSRLRDLGYIE